jgi:hypothetical protein
MLKIFEIAGLAGIILIIIFLILLPVIVTLIVGIAFANMLGFTGLYWWAFIILFYLIVSAILGLIGR